MQVNVFFCVLLLSFPSGTPLPCVLDGVVGSHGHGFRSRLLESLFPCVLCVGDPVGVPSVPRLCVLDGPGAVGPLP